VEGAERIRAKCDNPGPICLRPLLHYDYAVARTPGTVTPPARPYTSVRRFTRYRYYTTELDAGTSSGFALYYSYNHMFRSITPGSDHLLASLLSVSLGVCLLHTRSSCLRHLIDRLYTPLGSSAI
jgi:hypothetical protein